MSQNSANLLEVIILAAGKGTRMYSSTPKVLHRVGGHPLLAHVINSATALGAYKIHVVIGYEGEAVQAHFPDAALSWAMQSEQLGTGHAVAQALPNIPDDRTVLVLYGDVPLIQPATLQMLTEACHADGIAVLSVLSSDPTGLGRIVRDKQERVVAIVEEKDANPQQKLIQETNSGILAAPAGRLRHWLERLSPKNAQGEYYLTDVIASAVADECEVTTLILEDELEVLGVNNKLQLAQLERHYQRGIAEQLMLAGVGLSDPARIDVRGTLQCGRDVEIDINAIFEGEVTLGNGVHIGPNVFIKNSHIGAGSHIYANSHIEEARVADNCVIGPFARLRTGTNVADGAKIGNFVETKKARVGKGSKINHLSNVGDATVGDNVNIGAGTITCNYDGVNKHHTTIEDDVFVGSNTALVAPVVIGKKATIGAGSTITKDVGGEELGLARGRQRNIDSWKRPTKK